VNALAASGNAARAKPIIDDAVKQNPGDPSLIRLQWLIYLTLKDYKGAIAVGEEMVKTDTASADTTYFTRMMAAAVTDSQIPKAAEIAARGVAKFPNNIGLITALAQLQRQSGQTQQSIETLKKVIASDPKAKGVWLQIVRAQMDMNAPTDSIIYSLQQAKAAGDSAALVGGFALTVGNRLYKQAGTDKSLAGFQQALAMLKFADETAPRAEGKFLIGATNLQMAQLLLTDAGEKKSCDLAKQGQNALTDAQINLPAGGQFDPKTAQQLLGYVAQYAPYADQLVKRLCK
jgi:predicted Zn-dependent protease